MTRNGFRLAVLVTLVASAAEEAAYGQWSRAGVNRPSQQSASSYLGRTGGRHTREYTASETQSLRRMGGGFGAGASDSFGGFSLGGGERFFGYTPRFRTLGPTTLLPAMQSGGYLGYRSVQSGPAARNIGRASDYQLGQASDLLRATSNHVPLGGFNFVRLESAVSSPYFASETGRDAVQRFFGQSTARQQPEALQRLDDQPIRSMSELLEESNARSLAFRKQRAYEAFKEATATDVTDRAEKHARLRHQFQSIADLDRADAVSCLLLVYLSLSQQQSLASLRYLKEAVARNPTVFLDGLDLSSYFGDAQLLQRDMRAALQVLERDQDAAESNAVAAYCAWAMGDPVRAKQAVERLIATSQRDVTVDSRLVAVGYALSAALN